MIEALLKIAASYLLGSLMGGLIVGRLRGGVDIRTLGSGNAGGTNALRTQGGLFALGVMLIDVGKGILATRVVAPLDLPGIGSGSGLNADWLAVLCGIAVIVGHVYPLWYGFRGGKGVATLLGTLLGVEVWLLVPLLITWLVAVVLGGYVGLASIAAAVSLPVYVVVSGYEPRDPWLFFGVAIAVIIAFTHRSNIVRMRRGTEPRARRLWLLGRGRV